MSVYLFETWVIKPEHLETHAVLWKEYVQYMKNNRDLFKGIISMQILNKLEGQGTVTHLQIVEFNSVEDKEALDWQLSQDIETLQFKQQLMLIKDPKTTTQMLTEPLVSY